MSTPCYICSRNIEGEGESVEVEKECRDAKSCYRGNIGEETTTKTVNGHKECLQLTCFLCQQPVSIDGDSLFFFRRLVHQSCANPVHPLSEICNLCGEDFDEESSEGSRSEEQSIETLPCGAQYHRDCLTTYQTKKDDKQCPDRPCPANTCRFRDCKQMVLTGRSFCRDHSCSYNDFDCSIMRKSEELNCFIPTVTLSSKFCQKHICQYDGCLQPKHAPMREGDYDRSGRSNYCETHRCKFVYNRSSYGYIGDGFSGWSPYIYRCSAGVEGDDGACSEHQCQLEECRGCVVFVFPEEKGEKFPRDGWSTSSEDNLPPSKYCLKHNCNYRTWGTYHCHNRNIGSSSYCEEHACQFEGCSKQIRSKKEAHSWVGTTTYCEDHACNVSVSVQSRYQKICPKPVVGGSKFCDDHKCKVDKCSKDASVIRRGESEFSYTEFQYEDRDRIKFQPYCLYHTCHAKSTHRYYDEKRGFWGSDFFKCRELVVPGGYRCPKHEIKS